MGVTGLWQIVHPCARPIKLETLNRKRLAVDASIWIYQFLKAVRDKEGNALRNSHVVGFFRRICKLLFFGIKPVFVFDGGAPALKRQTISGRKQRREGRREDAVRTAGRLLAVQMQRRAEEEEQKRKDERDRPQEEPEEEVVPDEQLVYADENLMTQQERQQNRKFRRKDAYHLPDLDVSLNEMGAPNDPRIMSLEELQSYAKQFETGEDINVYDFSKIDYDSSFFMSLPPSDRYNILNAARLRSRLRMGHSKEQLDSMFPDRMAFSKFQIERVQERNELTQRLMHLNETGDALFNGGRVAGEKGREYVLVKNDGVEGGWALGVISDEGTKQETAIDLDKPAPAVKEEDGEWEEDDDFEDVPIEGLNRLPKRPRLDNDAADGVSRQRQDVYKSRKRGARRKPKAAADPNSLFVQDEPEDGEEDEEWEEVDGTDALFGEGAGEQEDEELSRAIAMSLEDNEAPASQDDRANASEAEEDDMLEVFNQSAVPEARPIPKGGGRAIANLVNKRAFDTAPDSHEVTSFGVPAPRSDESDQEDDAMDLQAALAESRRTKRKASSPPRRQQPPPKASKPAADPAKKVAKQGGFSGPLPFEKLDLGSSLLGRKKMQERSEETAGGFENPDLEKKEQQKRKAAAPLPPWFSGSLDDDIEKQKALENEDRQRAKEFSKQFRFQRRDEGGLRRHDTREVIDLEAEEDGAGFSNGEVIDLEAEESGTGFGKGEVIDLEADEDDKDMAEDGMVTFDPKVRMGDIADKARVEPPTANEDDQPKPSPQRASKTGPFQVDDSDEEDAAKEQNPASVSVPAGGIRIAPNGEKGVAKESVDEEAKNEEDEEMIDWSESEDDQAQPSRAAQSSVEKMDSAAQRESSRSPSVNVRKAEDDGQKQPIASPSINATELDISDQKQPSRSPSVEFEDVDIPENHAPRPTSAGGATQAVERDDGGPAPASGLVHQDSLPDDVETAEFDDFSDPEDEELLHQLTLEAEEHARFASTLNNKTQAQNIADYEKELKQLRNQQKKDRRDADEVTHVMVQECQQLLRLFGLPYVTAPMEAEAQCAELVRLGLVDGIVTDDSDCFLFGGTRIYKNMFNSAKFVECYLTSDMEKEFDLTRDKLISVAHLLGSDYTEGLPGVGPVTALEILSEFPTLEEFKNWLYGVQMNIIPKSDDGGNAFRKKFRRSATKLFLPPTFPDERVGLAYTNPDVDSDPEQFQWGVPDLDALRSFLMATIGWTQERTDEVLVPVIKDMNRRVDEGTQSNITAFFDGGVGIGAAGSGKQSARREAFAPRKKVAESSKRMGSALSRMAEKAKLGRSESIQEQEPDVVANGSVHDEVHDETKGTKTKTAKRAKPSKRDRDDSSEDGEDSDFEKPSRKSKKAAPAKKRTRNKKKDVTLSD
ncbi:DNA repair protein rad2 [Vermiconidia calcicola]|uniref:DNA repair protein rad2 n=1 Tax=Vermiconidia calcicola TaxID=1690605 RepID=A0ACC3N7M8_9PEZI|nr:DNA repair protein rad2 [Vermiconidia calcicola]